MCMFTYMIVWMHECVAYYMCGVHFAWMSVVCMHRLNAYTYMYVNMRVCVCE